ncbi:MAG: HEPN domain-containing protein [Cyanobacteria bacterium K_Offshore_surface_m2_239]|nr:HEPN domain-containing protein [Cyanobacteria bacterium K_Offshore_surface_m2_239]
MGGGSMAEADALALLAIARRDLQAARGMTDATVFHEAVWGFQVQQTIEKALKAWLYLSGIQPPFTHDLVALLKLLEEVGIDITPYRDLARFTAISRCRSATTINLICRTLIAPAATAGPKHW